MVMVNRKVRGTFTIEFALILLLLGGFLFYIGDSLTLVRSQSALERVSFSLSNVARESSLLYGGDSLDSIPGEIDRLNNLAFSLIGENYPASDRYNFGWSVMFFDYNSGVENERVYDFGIRCNFPVFSPISDSINQSFVMVVVCFKYTDTAPDVLSSVSIVAER